MALLWLGNTPGSTRQIAAGDAARACSTSRRWLWDNRMAATKNNRIGRSRMRYLKAPLQVQAERPTSSPLNHGTPILRGRYCRRMKHDQATMCGRRRAGDDEMKQRDCRRHHSSCLRRSSLWCWGGGVSAIVCPWVLLFLDISSRLPANQAHWVCANGRPTPNGFSCSQACLAALL
jgi:hypothetical protein